MRMDPDASSSGPGFGSRLARAFRNLVIFTVVVASLGGGGWALSVMNSKTFTLAVEGGKLVVHKGRLLPTGFEPWTPEDPGLAETYGPIELEGNTQLTVVGVKYGDRDELDRALFTVLELLAKPRVTSDAPADVEKGLVALRRAERLRGLSDEQKRSLKSMQSAVAYSLARTRLEDARRQLEDALAQLKLAADTDARHAKDATQMLLVVEPQVKAMSDVLRAAVHGLPIPTTAAPLAQPPALAPTRPEEAKADAGAAVESATGPKDSETHTRP